MGTKLSKKIMIACAFWVLLPLILLGLRFYSASSKLLRNQLMVTNFEHVKHIDAYYLTHVKDNLLYFLNLWSDDELLRLEGEETSDWMALKENWRTAMRGYPELLTIYFGSESGDFFNVNDTPVPDDYDPRKRPWYIKAVGASGEAIWTEPYEDLISGERIFSLAKAIYGKDNQLKGVLSIDVTLSEMTELLGLTRIGKEGRVMVIDGNGTIIVSPDAEKLGENLSNKPWAKNIFLQTEGSYIENNEEPLVISFVTNATTGWRVIGIMPEHELRAQVKPFKTLFYRVLWVVGVWALLGIGGFIWYINSRITRRIFELQKQMKLSEQGDLSVVESAISKNPDEIEALILSYNHMVNALREIISQIALSSNALTLASQSAVTVAQGYMAASSDQASEMEDLNASVETLNASIQGIKEEMAHASKGTHFVSLAMREMGMSASDVANNAVATSEAISEVLKSLEALDHASYQINENVKALNDLGLASVSQVHLGKSTLTETSQEMTAIQLNAEQLMETISTLKTCAEEVEDIIASVEDLTEQTSMLALNASIEAMRAGEHGKGFAAVASAIGRLSEKAKTATRHIEKILKRVQTHIGLATYQTEKSQSQVALGVQKTHQTLEAFNAIEKAVLSTAESIHEIGKSSAKQYAANQDILNASMRVNDLTMQVSASSQEQLATIEELVSATEKINGVIENNFNQLAHQSEISQNVAMVSESLSAVAIETATASMEMEHLAGDVLGEAKALLEVVSTFKAGS